MFCLKRIFSLFIFLCTVSVICPRLARAQEFLVIDVANPIKASDRKIIGLNLNAEFDGKFLFPESGTPLEKTLKEMNPGILRFHDLISSSSNNTPLDVDGFMKIRDNLNAEAVLVLDATLPAEKLIARFEEIRIKRKSNVLYWELSADGMPPTANLVTAFAKAVKQMDPHVRIGVPSGTFTLSEATKNAPSHWINPPLEALLKSASADIDYISLPCFPLDDWMTYEWYRTHEDELDLLKDIHILEDALKNWLSEKELSRLKFSIASVNSTSPATMTQIAWPRYNTLGHAVVLADLIGQFLIHTRIDMSFLDSLHAENTGGETPFLTETLTPQNNLNGTGLIMAIWGNFLLETIVSSEKIARVSAYASYSKAKHSLNIILVNKDTSFKQLTLQFKNYYVSRYTATTWVLTGSGIDDAHPRFEKRDEEVILSPQYNLILDPSSVSVLTIAP